MNVSSTSGNGVGCGSLSAAKLHKTDGPGGATNSVIPALPPSIRRFHMTTPQPADSPQPAPGWYANDLHPDDVAHLLDRFIKYFQPGRPDECWTWQGSRAPTGYGLLPRSQRSALLVHRVSWVAFTGRALTDNLTIDHLCNVKLCVNPDHLEPVTLFENIRRKSERLGYVIGAKTAGPDGTRKRRPARPLADDEDRKERARANALAYYYANREQVLAKRRASPRSTTQATCDECSLVLRRDGLRRHLKRTHGAP